MTIKPTEAEFEELKRIRDKALEEMVSSVCEKQGWDRNKVHFHAHVTECYCACPDGPCQHVWDGPEWTDAEEGSEDFNCVSRTCSRCGSIAMYHDMRFAP